VRKLLVRDALFHPMEASYGVSPDGKVAFIEMAQASGLQRLKEFERNPMITTTFGTGELIADALTHGARQIILGVGGSATNDAGIGIAEALGVIFFDDNEKRLEPIGKNLIHIHSIDATHLHPRLKEVEFTLLCDVDNPLHGPTGAAFVFAPQKGATPSMVSALDEGLQAYEKMLVRTFARNLNFPGAGAGGGVAATLAALTNVKVRSGMDFISELTDLKLQIERADVVITGEGKMDAQTLSGKVIQGIASLASQFGKPVFALVGKNELAPRQWREMGVHQVIALADGKTSDQEAMKNAFFLLQDRVREEIIPLLLSRRAD
jgi:glycerate kinase